MPYRIVHIADVHLDMAFTGLEPAAGDARRAQLATAFERALDLARERQADAVCIAGDLYESARATPDRGAYLTRVLGDLAPIRVFISPGNHDPHDRASLYRQMSLPPNVTVFATRRFSPLPLAPGLTLWGAAHEYALDRDPILTDVRCDGPGAHLLLFHGSDREHLPPGKECIAPFTAADVARSRAAHAMVGHFHGLLEGKRYAYPGSLEPHNASQDGQHTASLVIIEDGHVGLEFIPLNRTRYVSAEFDLSDLGDRAALMSALSARLRSIVDRPGEIFCRLRLVGSAPESLDVEIISLQRDLQMDFPGTIVEDAFVSVDARAVAREGYTVRSEFIKEMERRLAGSNDAERPVLERALRYGLLAFTGKRLTP